MIPRMANLSLCEACYRVECDKIGAEEVEAYSIKPLKPCDGCGGEGFYVRGDVFFQFPSE